MIAEYRVRRGADADDWDALLLCGDALNLRPEQGALPPPERCAIVTDPPYGIGHASNQGASWAGRRIHGDADTSTRDELAARFAGRPQVHFGSWRHPPPAKCRGVVVWDKGPAFGMGDLSFPWKASFELAYVCGPLWSSDYRSEGVLRGPPVVSWESRGRVHPHQKPVWLMEHFIRCLPKDLIIVDPFMGSGTTAIAAMRLGRRFVGVEIDSDYFAAARRRFEAELSQSRLPLGD